MGHSDRCSEPTESGREDAPSIVAVPVIGAAEAGVWKPPVWLPEGRQAADEEQLARLLAKRYGEEPNRWIGYVEQARRALSEVDARILF